MLDFLAEHYLSDDPKFSTEEEDRSKSKDCFLDLNAPINFDDMDEAESIASIGETIYGNQNQEPVFTNNQNSMPELRVSDQNYINNRNNTVNIGFDPTPQQNYNNYRQIDNLNPNAYCQNPQNNYFNQPYAGGGGYNPPPNQNMNYGYQNPYQNNNEIIRPRFTIMDDNHQDQQNQNEDVYSTIHTAFNGEEYTTNPEPLTIKRTSHRTALIYKMHPNENGRKPNPRAEKLKQEWSRTIWNRLYDAEDLDRKEIGKGHFVNVWNGFYYQREWYGPNKYKLWLEKQALDKQIEQMERDSFIGFYSKLDGFSSEEGDEEYLRRRKEYLYGVDREYEVTIPTEKQLDIRLRNEYLATAQHIPTELLPHPMTYIEKWDMIKRKYGITDKDGWNEYSNKIALYFQDLKLEENRRMRRNLSGRYNRNGFHSLLNELSLAKRAATGITGNGLAPENDLNENDIPPIYGRGYEEYKPYTVKESTYFKNCANHNLNNSQKNTKGESNNSSDERKVAVNHNSDDPKPNKGGTTKYSMGPQGTTITYGSGFNDQDRDNSKVAVMINSDDPKPNEGGNTVKQENNSKVAVNHNSDDPKPNKGGINNPLDVDKEVFDELMKSIIIENEQLPGGTSKEIENTDNSKVAVMINSDDPKPNEGGNTVKQENNSKVGTECTDDRAKYKHIRAPKCNTKINYYIDISKVAVNHNSDDPKPNEGGDDKIKENTKTTISDNISKPKKKGDDDKIKENSKTTVSDNISKPKKKGARPKKKKYTPTVKIVNGELQIIPYDPNGTYGKYEEEYQNQKKSNTAKNQDDFLHLLAKEDYLVAKKIQLDEDHKKAKERINNLRAQISKEGDSIARQSEK